MFFFNSEECVEFSNSFRECKKLCHKYTRSAEVSSMDYSLKKTSPV